MQKISPSRVTVLCLLWAMVVLVAHQFGLGLLVREELASLDSRFRLRGVRAASPDIVILAIDQRSMVADTFTPEDLAVQPQLALLKNYPFPRRVYADAIQKLYDAGARVVAFDLLFLSPKEDDARLRVAIEKYHDRVVLGSNFSDDGRQLLLPSVVMPESIPTESIAGYVNYWPDFDGGVRRERSRTTVSAVAHVETSPGEQPVLSFAALAARRTAPDGLINFAGPSGTYPVHPFYEMFYDKAWTRNLQDGAVFRDKIVLIGPAGNFQHDQHPTPFGRMDGVEIHANVIATLLHGDAPREARSIVGIVSVLALALATAMLLNVATHPLGKLGLLVAVGAAYFTVTQVAFASRGMVLWVAAPLWTVAGGGVAGIASQLLAEQLEKRRVRQTLERYVSKPVADEVLRHGEEYQNSLGGERKPVTILFSDIRGFTTIAEQATPSELVGQLNEYLTAMVDIVMEHNGTLDKFIGDAIMAVYGAPLSAGVVEDAWRAVQTASRMRGRLAELQNGWAAQGRPRLEIGVGINHGEALVGNIGSPQRMEYTVIGDVVNVASRIEGLNKEFGTDVLLAESVYEMVKERVEAKPMGMAEVKGREQKVMVYLLVRLKT